MPEKSCLKKMTWYNMTENFGKMTVYYDVQNEEKNDK